MVLAFFVLRFSIWKSRRASRQERSVGMISYADVLLGRTVRLFEAFCSTPKTFSGGCEWNHWIQTEHRLAP